MTLAAGAATDTCVLQTCGPAVCMWCAHAGVACHTGADRRGPRAFIAAGCWRVRVGRPAISRPVRSAPLGGASSSWWRGLGRARSPSSCCSWWSCSSDVCDGPSYPGTHLRCELCSGASGGGEPCANGLCAVAFLVAVWWVHSVCPVFCPLDNRPLTPLPDRGLSSFHCVVNSALAAGRTART